MAAWKGWATEFLSDAGIRRTAGAISFLADWHAHADTNCGNNPIDLSHLIPGSHDCAPLTSGIGQAQRYIAHSVASHAFDVQIHAKYARPILAALTSGHPYTVADYPAVEAALDEWGSSKFAQVYIAAANPATAGLKGPHALGGWKALRKSINKGMPDALSHSQRVNAQTLRTLTRARRVKV